MRWYLIEAYKEEPSRPTRGGGVAYLVNLEFDEIGESYQIIIPYGEFEYGLPYIPEGNKYIKTGMSGATYYTKTHTTMSGYSYYKFPILLFGSKEENLNLNGKFFTDLNEKEKIFINRVIANNIFNFLMYLFDSQPQKLEKILTENVLLSQYYPLFKMFKREKLFEYKITGAKIYIIEKANSWNSELYIVSSWYNPHLLNPPLMSSITSYVLWCPISKTKKYPQFKTENYIEICFKQKGQDGFVIVQTFPDMKKLVYYCTNHYSPHLIRGGEIYQQIPHDEVSMNKDIFDKIKFYLLNSRLGDLLFIPADFAKTDYLSPAQEMHLQKLQVLSGEIKKVDDGYIAQGTLFHPEHGFVLIDTPSKIVLVPGSKHD